MVSCSLCEVNDTRDWCIHVSGQDHKKSAANKGSGSSECPGRQVGVATRSNQAVAPSRAWATQARNHNQGPQQVDAQHNSTLGEVTKNQNGLTIEGTFDFGYVDPSSTLPKYGAIIKTMNRNSASPSTSRLLEIKLASNQGNVRRSTIFSIEISGTRRTILPNHPITLTLVLRHSYRGRYEDRADFIFEDVHLGRRFMISRTLRVIVANRVEHDTYRPIVPYVPRPRIDRRPMNEIVPGQKPPALMAITYVGELPQAYIPTELHKSLARFRSTSEAVAQIKKTFLPTLFNCRTYAPNFKHLLWIEEYQMGKDLERYDIPHAKLSRHNNYYYLPVPGLAEKRPSVLVGDCILTQEQGARDGRWFEGHVHFVRKSEVGLRFHGSFGRHSESTTFHIRFRLNRIPLRREHQALDSSFNEERVLFPTKEHLSLVTRPAKDTSIKLYNPLLSDNPPQLQAVISILSQRPGSPTFVVFGPPGTGKTVTIVESILQVVAANRTARVFACAPSNSAADLLASRLAAHLSIDELFRFYAPSRFKDQVPDKLRSYVCTLPDGHFSVPPMARMRRFRVVVSTCVSASFASGIGMPRGHFSHIFVDEAGQATEPEAFISIKTIADDRTNVILSGDPKQLGPILRSTVAQKLGLEISYLERLMHRDAYNLKTGFGKFVVKLVKNFRSHNSILQFPNERFYGNELQECGNPVFLDKHLRSPLLPSPKFPVIFHAISGKDAREASSPSFFNIDEILQVKAYVQRLKNDRNLRTVDADIGVIAPYHAQCMKLKTALRSIAEGVKVGSVEEFQGQERSVIIISTVRSSKEFVEYDVRHTLGFVANPRRFNVAITRAKALLIVVGDPQVLSLDPLWRSFLNYIHQNGGWTGPDITWDPSVPVDEAGGYDKAIRESAKLDMNEFTKLMETLTMAEVDEELDANVDKPWGDVE